MIELVKKGTKNAKNEILSGLTVALALVPEAVAFSFVAGIDPLIGLYGAFMMGIITSIFGGRPGMISGATGAMAVVMVGLIKAGNEIGLHLEAPVANLGISYLFITLLLVGILQILFGVFKLGKFIRLIPHPVMMGFVNGLAIVIFLSQLGMFKEKIMNTETGKAVTQWLPVPELLIMGGFVALTMAIMFLLPKLTKKVPAALTAIIIVSAIVIIGGIDTNTVKSFIVEGSGNPAAGIKGGLPSLQLDLFTHIPINLATFKLILPYAFILAAVGLIESLLTLNLIDELTETRGNSNKECIAQGSANFVNGMFGGMGGCAMIGQSIINVNSGGKGRLSGIVAAVALLCFILFAAPLIEQVPIAALVGVMFMVVIGTFAWSSFRIITKIPRADAFVLILVSSMTVVFDLAIAVVAGVIVSALVFSWENAKRIRARRSFKADGTKVYEIWGPLFFGSIQAFTDKFTVNEDPDNIEIDFIESKVSDHSGVEAIFNLVEKYEKKGKKVTLKHLSPDCDAMLIKASPKFAAIIQTDIDDPRYYVVTNQVEPI
ncbi:sodium-independent anion transporter [Putridiphycobacter roseus]|uniref:Sodium-independent anion transporter n=1 Tax=Putridiphycobacter roseus TaxID=2219161 RepID=A0A2W1NT40_9FLAO|nr:SulP family inorganic anion transporter [Putridiphycobacter roseus]PZE17858.1 sodium-independent anion transporter [Putridiphycobacter roseus]